MIAALVGLSSASAFFAPGQVEGHDTVIHLWGAWAYLQAWHAGDLLPIWLHQLGLGQPMPLFYGPLPFWVMAPFAGFGGGPAAMFSGSLILASVVSALSAWSAVAVWTHDRRAALVAATAWTFAPYRLLDVNYRNALGEAWSLALLPLALLAFERLLDRSSRRRIVAAAGATALILVAHPLSLPMLAIAVAVLALARVLRHRSRAPALWGAAARSLGAAAAGILLAGFFSLPLVLESRFINLRPALEADGDLRFATHGLHVGQLFARELWGDLLWSHTDAESALGQRDMPFYFGVVLAAAIVGAALLGFAGRSEDSQPLLELAALGSVMLALTLQVVARSPLRPPGIEILQFPWRMLGPASAAAALALGLLVARAGRRSSRQGAICAIVCSLAVLVDGFPSSGAVARFAPWSGLSNASVVRFLPGVQRTSPIPHPWPLRAMGILLPPEKCCADVGEYFSEYHEYFTPASHVGARFHIDHDVGLTLKTDGGAERNESFSYARRLKKDPEEREPLVARRGKGRIVVELPDDLGGQLEISEQYFPGWQVDSSGSWREAASSEQGLLVTGVPPGRREVHFRFDRWRWDRTLGWLASAATAVGLLLFAGVPDRRI